jgi:galactokinase
VKETVRKAFAEVFGEAEDVRVYFAPGRVNLIGEHTDYNGGHVFPCAISFGTYAAAAKRNDRKLRFYSVNFKNNGVVERSIDDFRPLNDKSWTSYPKGVMWAFEGRGYHLTHGLDLLIYGNIPAEFPFRITPVCSVSPAREKCRSSFWTSTVFPMPKVKNI